MEKIRSILVLISILSLSGIFSACSFSVTRTETDTFTITDKDTTNLYFVKNAPGNRDNGVIYPSSREFKSERDLIQQDSVQERFYPDFIRLGVFESVGLFLGGDSKHSLGTGIFGVYPDNNIDYSYARGDKDNVFVGGIYRFGISEARLRWFRDAKDWTWGFTLFEAIVPDARIEKALFAIPSLSLKKRYYLDESIPYLCISPSVSLGLWPSQYLNTSVSIDLGSLSGLNLRAYLGYAFGQNTESSMSVKTSKYTREAQSVSFLYAGFGVSILDFHNRVPETYTEWKDHDHSGWDVGFMQLALLGTGADQSIFVDEGESSTIQGIQLKLLNSTVAIPVLDNKFFFSTSLINFLVLGKTDFGIGILPIRIGRWQTILNDELSVEPFIEYNYFPSDFVNLGAKVNLRMGENFNVGLLLGYAKGSAVSNIGNEITENFGNPTAFSGTYIGLNLGIFDRIFFPQELRYNK